MNKINYCFICATCCTFLLIGHVLAGDLPNNSESSDQSALATEPQNNTETSDQSALATEPQNNTETSNQSALATESQNNTETSNQSAAATQPQNNTETLDQSAAATQPQNNTETLDQSAAATQPQNNTEALDQSAAATQPQNNTEALDQSAAATQPLNSTEILDQSSAIQEEQASEKRMYRGGTLDQMGLRAAVFMPMGSRFKEIYGKIGPSLQLEVAKKQKNHRNWETWGNIEWIFMDGKPRQACGTTDINIVNLAIGLKAVAKIFHDSVFIYAGIGPDLGIVLLENTMNCCTNFCSSNRSINESKEDLCKVRVGGMIKTGSQINFAHYYYLDLFADYLYLPVSYHHTVDVGGFKFGAGLGGRF